MAGADSDVRPGSESPKEDDATKATREELKHTAISEKKPDGDQWRALTPPDVLKDQVGSPKKKRAHDEVDDDDDNDGEQLRSRSKLGERSDEEDAASASGASNGGSGGDGGRSDRAEPEKKRLRDQEAAAAKTDQTTVSAADKDSTAKDDKPLAAPSSSAFSSSGFAKLTSTASPFGSLSGAGASGRPSLSVFGSSATASSTASPFGSTATKPALAPTVPKLSFGGAGASVSPFAAMSGASSGKLFGSPFGSSSSSSSTGTGGGFGSGATGGSAFGSGLPSARLTSFAQPGSAFKSDKPAKPFGAPESDAEESEGDESGSGADEEDKADSAEGNEEGGDVKETDERSKAGGEEKKKPKLQRVAVNDGEMGEATVIQVRARMYYLDKDQGGWKERGAGMLKLNVPEGCVEYDRGGNAIPASFDASMLGADKEDEGDEAEAGDAGDAGDAKSDIESSAAGHGGNRAAAVPTRSVVRLIMRQDSTHRVILNTVVLAATEFQDRQTLKSTTVLFTAFEGEDAKPVSVQMKMNAANAKTFLTTMEGIQRELRGD